MLKGELKYLLSARSFIRLKFNKQKINDNFAFYRSSFSDSFVIFSLSLSSSKFACGNDY